MEGDRKLFWMRKLIISGGRPRDGMTDTENNNRAALAGDALDWMIRTPAKSLAGIRAKAWIYDRHVDRDALARSMAKDIVRLVR